MAITISGLRSKVTEPTNSTVTTRLTTTVNPVIGAEFIHAVQMFYPNGFPPLPTITTSIENAVVVSRDP